MSQTQRLRMWWQGKKGTTLACIFGAHSSCDRIDCLCDHHYALDFGDTA